MAKYFTGFFIGALCGAIIYDNIITAFLSGMFGVLLIIGIEFIERKYIK